MFKYRHRKNIILLIFIITAFSSPKLFGQNPGIYPQFTKWYQDPLGLRPLQLSTAMGFVWGSAAVASSLIFTKKDQGFRKEISLYNETLAGKGYKPPYTHVLQNESGIIYDIRTWMSVGLGLNSLHFKDQTNDTWCFGIRPFARWYPVRTNKTKIFVEYGAGISYSLQRFPLTGTGLEADTARTGTKFNLTSKYGIGFIIKYDKHFSIVSGFRHFHLSNGNIAGIERNPSHDSNGFFAGVIYRQ